MIYIDMDGVVADFEGGYLAKYGEAYGKSAKVSEFWRNSEGFFADLPAIPEGITLVKTLLLLGLKVCFMTSTGGGEDHLGIARQKLEWLQKHGFDSHPVAFCTGTANKGDFAQRGAILVDDREKVCAAWNENGGCPVLFDPLELHSVIAQIVNIEVAL